MPRPSKRRLDPVSVGHGGRGARRFARNPRPRARGAITVDFGGEAMRRSRSPHAGFSEQAPRLVACGLRLPRNRIDSAPIVFPRSSVRLETAVPTSRTLNPAPADASPKACSDVMNRFSCIKPGCDKRFDDHDPRQAGAATVSAVHQQRPDRSTPHQAPVAERSYRYDRLRKIVQSGCRDPPPRSTFLIEPE